MQRLPIAQAAERLGISKTAMRRRVERRTVDAIKGDDGQWLVAVPESAEGSPLPTGVAREVPPGMPRGIPAVDALAGQLAYLQERLAARDDEIREMRTGYERQINELHVLLQSAQRQLPPVVPSTARADEQEPPRQTTPVAPGGAQREPEVFPKQRWPWWMRILGGK